jgi:tetratricopeptide (TPR) repeat protein
MRKVPTSRSLRPIILCLAVGFLTQSAPYARGEDLDTCQAQEGSVDATIEACTRTLKSDLDAWRRRSATLLSFRARALIKKRDPNRALADLTEAIRIDGSFERAYEGRGDLYRDNNQCAEAITDYTEAIRLQPERIQNYVSRGMCLIVTSDFDRARADLNQAIKLDAENSGGYAALAWNAKALLEGKNGNLDRAIADYAKAIQLSPTRISLYIERAGIWSSKGSVENAFADYDKAIALDKENSGGFATAGWASKARLHAIRGDLEDAIVEYGQAIRLSPKLVPLYLDRAALWSRKGDTERALTDYAEAIKAEPKGALAYNSRGDFFRDQGQYDKAIADYDKAAENQPGNMASIGSRALTQFFRGDFGKAAQDFAKVFDTEPNTYTLLWLYISRGQAETPKQARAEIAKLSTKLSGDDWPAPIVQLALGKKTSADAILSSATTPEQKCEAQFYVGEWQLLQKDRSEAIKALQAAADSCPKDATESMAAREELKRLKTAAR